MRRRRTRRPTTCTCRGVSAADQHTKKSLESALDLLHQAIKLDPGYEPSWTELSLVYSDVASRGLVSMDEALAQAREAASQALKLNPKSARAHVALGLIHMNIDWDWAGADREFRQALALDPGDATVLVASGALELALGQTARAATLFQQALSRDPLHASSYSNLGITYYAEGRLPDAEAAFRKSLELKPNGAYTHNGLPGWCCCHRGTREAALTEMGHESDEGWRLEGLAIVNHALGKRAEVGCRARRASGHLPGGLLPYRIATVYAVSRRAGASAFKWSRAGLYGARRRPLEHQGGSAAEVAHGGPALRCAFKEAGAARSEPGRGFERQRTRAPGAVAARRAREKAQGQQGEHARLGHAAAEVEAPALTAIG